MTEVTLTVREILNTANKLCDDSINHNTLIQYFNIGVNAINSYANLKLPLISYSIISQDSNAANVYDVCNQAFTNNKIAFILINFVAKTIREVDGYPIESNEFNSEYAALLVAFSAKYKQTVKPEFQLEEGDFGNLVTSPISRTAHWLRKNKLY